MTKKRACAWLALAVAIALLPISAAWMGARAEQVEEPEASAQATASPTPTPTASPTITESASPTASESTSPTASVSASPTSSASVEPTSSESVEPTSSASVEPTSSASVEPTSSASVEPTSSESVEPTSSASVEPTSSASVEPTSSESASPTASASVTPTPSESATPTAEPTAGTTATPEPTATVYPTLQLGDTGEDVTNLQNRLIALNYLDGTIEGMPTGVFDEDTQTAVMLFQQQNSLEATGIADDGMQQILYGESTPAYGSGEGPEGPGGMPGGGGGGGRSGGGSVGGGEMEVETGIVPGEALTSNHASGTKDMTTYWAVDTDTADESEQTLTLGGASLDISLADGTFVAAVEEGVLTLTADAEATWSINGYALKILSISGITQVTFVTNGKTTTIPTEDYLSGTAYAALRAEGYVSKDFTIELTLSSGLAAAVEAAGETYPVDGSAMILNAQSD